MNSSFKTVGMGREQLVKQTLANAVRVYNAGAMALRPVGRTVGNAYREALQAKYSMPGTGKKHPNLPFPSSAPGQPPAAQTGELKNSIRVSVSRVPGRAGGQFVKGFGQTVIKISTTLPYAAQLEFGTGSGGKGTAARPAWTPVNTAFSTGTLVSLAIQNAKPINFVSAERAAAAAGMMAVASTTLGRETNAGR